jgi:hypothetical protein
MAISRTPPLEDRIKSIRTEIDAIIDVMAEAESKRCPGIPVPVLRNLITGRAGACQCQQHLSIEREEAAGATKGKDAA